MLEKKSKNYYFDAHFHASLCDFDVTENVYGCSCAHSKNEWEKQINYGNRIIQSYGIHPQNVGDVNLTEEFIFIDELCSEHKIQAIGECGIDLYSPEYKQNKELQIEVFLKQIEIATFHNLPVVIHCRKGNEYLFKYRNKLEKLPGILLHSFMGNYKEASSLLDKNINVFFSYGKQIFNNNKKVLDCIKNLPFENLLFETDAPYQYLKGEKFTSEIEIKKIYKEAYRIRSNETNFDFFCERLMLNASNCFQFEI